MIRYKDANGNIQEIEGMLSTGLFDMNGGELFNGDKVHVSLDDIIEPFDDTIICLEGKFYLHSQMEGFSAHTYDLNYMLENFDICLVR